MIILLAHENEINNYVLNPSKKIIDFIIGTTKTNYSNF